MNLGRKNAFWQIMFSNFLGNLLTRKIFEHSTFQEIFSSNEHYDAVILEQFSSDALKVVAHKFNAPLILFHGVGATNAVNLYVGNPSPRSYISDIYLRFPSKMTFLERLENFVVSVFVTIYKHFYYFPEQEKIVKEFYPNAPDLNSIIFNTSLILLMAHETTQQAVPLVPNMINVGGLHMKPPKPLGNMQSQLDSATDGVVYFGMGTNIKLSTTKNETQKAFMKCLGKLKQKVFMQWNEEIPADLPGNIVMAKWFPQQSILGKHKIFFRELHNLCLL